MCVSALVKAKARDHGSNFGNETQDMGGEQMWGGGTETAVDHKVTLATGANKHRWIAPRHRRSVYFTVGVNGTEQF